MSTIILNNGKPMPKIGIGTFLLKPEEAERAVFIALQNGYRSVDTANIYMNEKAVGRAIAKSGVPREEIFLTSKIWPSQFPYAKAKKAIDLEAYRASMAGVYSTSISEQTLDEAPMAYKSLADIIDVIRDTVDIIEVMKPVYNFKAPEGELPWKTKEQK